MPTKPEDARDLVLDVQDLQIHFALQGSGFARLFGKDSGVVKAVDGVSVALQRGEVLGLVGESGSGKTTLGRAMLGLAPTTSGSIRHFPHDGSPAVNIADLHGKALRERRTQIQMVFQDPHAALNPSMTLETAVGHPLVIHKRARGQQLRQEVINALDKVGLSPAEQFLSKYPSDLSGGQKQRAVIARAIILKPEVLVADEPVSMLDMSVRAKILQLMLDVKDDLGLTYVYITHDLATAKYFCDRVAIMYLGRVVEIGPTDEIFAHPRHPYTQALLRAIPDMDPTNDADRDLPRGEIPDAAKPPRGCSFHPRCPLARAECGWEPRDLKTLVEQHWTHVPVDTFESESALLGDLKDLDHSDDVALLRRPKGDAGQISALFDQIRESTADDPLWAGVVGQKVTDEGVEFRFAPATDVHLNSVGRAEVACVLYPQTDARPGKQS